ncbi:fumarylacetoacetate hydrolase [Pseudomonas delhiensis]|uniref:fumarylacetoacetase n=1 Tax=Pseudomonas delhiensis TaxID=366289 RepID=A0A239N1Q3_9PSED|nr:fumarylacetoacetase [Pseudomonas delhiensis]SDK46953.1 fumarylacetoacetate hydrolase [Pseudomonas delhiensis]SNT48947.1 fumarylacetoacetate hydrolase [Pseudomonas delhiensis]
MNQADNRRSWIESANGHPDFPLQNLPLGVFSSPGREPRGGVAIGEHILDLKAALAADLFEGEARHAAEAASGASLNAFFALGAGPRRVLREQLQALLAEGSPRQARMQELGATLLPAQASCQLHLPAQVGDYTDFYVGIHHANNVGRLFRPDNPLLPNYKHVPIGYHGRASTVVASGAAVRRPNGQTLAPGAEAPTFGPSKRLDYELELGIWIGPGNAMGEAIGIGQAEQHVAGYCLLNDWSARDVQAWEYQPLGPFLAKNFATSVSPWVVTAEALAPFRKAQPPRPEGDPQPLPYLLDEHDQAHGALDIQLEVLLQTAAMREQGVEPVRLALSNTRNMYWTVAQMVAHHSVGGCKLQAGDLFGSGTLSGPQPEAFGSLLESTFGGKQPLELPGGEQRTFLQDGDEVIFRAWCEREGYPRIGFGECRGVILPAR